MIGELGVLFAYFAQLVNLCFELGAVLVLLDRTQEQIHLSNNNFGQGAGPGWTAGAGTSTSAEGGRVRRMNGSSLQVLCRIWRERSRSRWRDHGGILKMTERYSTSTCLGSCGRQVCSRKGRASGVVA